MKIEEYKAQFLEFTEQAMKLSNNFKSKNDLQQKVMRLSSQAVEFYNKNSDPKESDYQLKIEIFLDFDNFLKTIKRDVLFQSQDKRKSIFASPKQIKPSDSYETVSSLDCSITL
ncbi:hypothetical protein DGG96_14225 [Legionella qingyii]|uniref:Uncharacterized protein n=1 Tax=Legionella qingyii TaxID=2184757 RepID=A0A317U2I4_9GAMM|nr:hypothetical protein [Legionella qingyii]PWY54956.1 hypothetical protein DGG96_14225 [Legionella qingyii]RUR20995.1 hypothetical protein ELY20_13690 [Legionella qingyii]RUR27914.1 hypothetical protein ELY16_03825 [Legionella qingyii]